jgi:hypothetical protein
VAGPWALSTAMKDEPELEDKKDSELAFSLGGVSFRHTRDFSEISVNKINNLRKSDYPGIFRGAKNIFRGKKYHAIGTKK